MKTYEALFYQCGILMCLAFITGCSTLLSNQTPPIQIVTTNNQPATAEIQPPKKQAYKITIPSVIHVRPSSFDELSITVTDPCFKSFSTHVSKTIQPVYWANIFTYFVGFPLDYISGYMWQYDKTVHIPLVKNDNLSETCIKKHTEKPIMASTLLPKTTFRKHYFTAGFLSQTPSHRYDSDATPASFFLEYGHQLNRELMTSLKFFAGVSNDYYQYNCGQLAWQCSENISTEHATLSFSLRQYINPNANFYAGLGMAQKFIQQTVGYDNNVSSVMNSAIFLDIGWQMRGRTSLQINASIDLAEFYLTNPRLYYNQRRSASSSPGANKKANALLKGAALTSNISLGFTLGF